MHPSRAKGLAFFSSDAIAGLATAAIAFCVYLATLARSVQFEDGGELAAAFASLGIAHPTGYPLLTLLANAFSRLPLGESVLWRLNLLMGLMAAAAVYFFFRVFRLLLSEAGVRLFRGPAAPSSPGRARFAAALAALTLAFSRTVWSEALSVEVYAFHLFFLGLVSWLFLRALSSAASGEPAAGRHWLGFAFALGLSFSNHMMTVLLAPAFLLLYFQVSGTGAASWKRLAWAVPAFAAGLLPYLYLPLRAAQRPWVNWGNPVSWEAFADHLAARQFRYQMFSSLETALNKSAAFLKALPAEFGYLPLIAAALGTLLLARRQPRLLAFVALLFASCVFYTVNYAFDDPNYYVNAHFALALLVAVAARAALDKGVLPRLLCALLPLFPLALNYRAVDQSRNFAVEDYARNVLASLDSNATILVGDWEYFYPVAEYLTTVEGLRPDVRILSTSLMKFPWYYAQLERRDPALVAAARPEVEAFLKEADAFFAGSADAPANTAAYDAALARVLQAFAWSDSSRPLYVVSETIGDLGAAGSSNQVEGLVARLYPDSAIGPPRSRTFAYRPFSRLDAHTLRIRRQYAIAYVNLGLYWSKRGDAAASAAYASKALAAAPDDAEIAAWAEGLGAR
jgi:hypothetical protein